MLLKARYHPSRAKSRTTGRPSLFIFTTLVVITFWIFSPTAKKSPTQEVASVGPLTRKYVEEGRSVGGSKFPSFRDLTC